MLINTFAGYSEDGKDGVVYLGTRPDRDVVFTGNRVVEPMSLGTTRVAVPLSQRMPPLLQRESGFKSMLMILVITWLQ